MNIQRHPEVDSAVRGLPQPAVDSLEAFEHQITHGGDLSLFINTKPFSENDGVGKRTRLEHYHLRPCEPVCYLVWLVRTVDTAYVLEVSEHPSSGTFASAEIEGRLYSRLSDLTPQLGAYQLPATYESGIPVRKKDMYGARLGNGTPTVVPVRTSNSDYLPLGQLLNLPDVRTRVGVIVGTVELPRDEVPNEAMECIDYEEHPERESLSLFIGGWMCHAGLYRRETEHLILLFCPLHCVVMGMSNRRPPTVDVFSELVYLRLVDRLREKFPSVDGKERELEQKVELLLRHFPLYRG